MECKAEKIGSSRKKYLFRTFETQENQPEESHQVWKQARRLLTNAAICADAKNLVEAHQKAIQ